MRYVTPEEMSASERHTWRVVNEFHHTNPDAWPSLQTIADITGMSRWGVQKVLKSMEAKNLVGVNHVGGNGRHETNRYVCSIPEAWLQRMETEGNSVAKQRQLSSHSKGNPVAMKVSGGKASKEATKGEATPLNRESPSPNLAESRLDELGYPTAAMVVEKLGLTDKPEKVEWNWSMHCSLLGEDRDPQLVRDVVHWFPGNPSKKKDGKPYWSFITTMSLLLKHWDKMEAQCREDLYGGRRLKVVGK